MGGYTWRFHHTKALKDGQSWLDSNPEADAEEIKEKHKEIEGICVSWNEKGIARYCQVSSYKVKEYSCERFNDFRSDVSNSVYLTSLCGG